MLRQFDPEEPELMDLPQPVTAGLERDLANLVSLNRWFGSHRLLNCFLRRWWREGEIYRVLDLCTGAGDLPRAMADFARVRGITLRVIAVDANPATLEIARRLSNGYDEIDFIEADALTFGASGEFDLVHCALALHHFSERDAVRLLARCSALSRRWILVSDLERSFMTKAAIWLLTALFYREPMTRHDGRLSANRAFSFTEMAALADAAAWTGFSHARFPFCRQAIWVDTATEVEECFLPAEGCPG